MRVYVPATTTLLRVLLDTGQLGTGQLGTGQLGTGQLGTGQLGTVPQTAFAVTPGLREWYVDDDVEALEYAAMSEAARASLRLVDGDPDAVPRRVVVATDVPDAAVRIRDDLDRGVVEVSHAIRLSEVASVHVDDRDAEAAVAAAAGAVIAADLGDAHAQDVMDDAEGFELSWYASQELGGLLADM